MEPSGRGMEGSAHPPSGPLVSWQASPTSTPGDSSSGSNSNKEEGPLAHMVTATALSPAYESQPGPLQRALVGPDSCILYGQRRVGAAGGPPSPSPSSPLHSMA